MTHRTPTNHADSTSSGRPSSATSGGGGGPLDQDLLARAYRKLMDRQTLTDRERAALKRHEKEKEERLRWQYYRSIPHKHWRQMSGRQTKVINEQAQRYGLPFGGHTVNLPLLAKAIHDFLADRAVALAKDGDELLQGASSPALERYREERALLARLDRLERERQLLPRDQVRQALGRIAAILRGAGEGLQRQFGPSASDLLDEALDDAQEEIARSFPAPQPEGPDVVEGRSEPAPNAVDVIDAVEAPLPGDEA